VTEFLILPGIGGSGEDHWQTVWQVAAPEMRRIEPKSWDHPDLTDWIASLDRTIAACPLPPILIAHSLSCLLVPLWQRKSVRAVRGAFLVGVPDPASPAFPVEAGGFGAVPEKRLGFPSLILASTDDPYGSVDYARSRAKQWGSDLIILGPLGHINGASGLGAWPEGMAILNRFAEELTA
jgi:predicted alpha/beta hydrolase family esterase